MPEHVHLLISEPQRGTPSTILQKLKLLVARKLRQRKRSGNAAQMRLPFAGMGEPLRAFWQARFYDFNVYTRGKKIEKLNYMHAESGEARIGATSEGLGVEQLEILSGRRGIGENRYSGMRGKGKPKTQVPKTGTWGTLRLHLIGEAMRFTRFVDEEC